MSEVKYPAYRQYEEIRIDVNNAMLALLAGSKIADDAVVNAGDSEEFLSTLFPTIEHIKRFDLRVGPASDYLGKADTHLARMSITYALAIHEDFILSMTAFASSAGISVSTGRITAKRMHSRLFLALGHQVPQDWMDCFQLIRCMRNSVIHQGGRVQQELTDLLSNMSTGAEQVWQRLNDQAPADVVQNGELVLIASHIFSAFAVVKRLGREVNVALAGAIPAQRWADICVEDYRTFTKKVRNSPAWRRALIGYAKSHYGPLQLTEADLESAARISGAWTLGSWP